MVGNTIKNPPTTVEANGEVIIKKSLVLEDNGELVTLPIDVTADFSEVPKKYRALMLEALTSRY